MRQFVIGDIHGCAKALRSLIEAIEPQRDDEVIFLGDYIDRGPDSRDVVQQVLELRQRCQVVPLRGNHEIMLMGVVLGGIDETIWLENGGLATVTSYGGSIEKIPPDHLEFYRNLEPYYETKDLICVHAGYDPSLEMHEQDSGTAYWNHLPDPLPPPHKSGKRVFVGHTPQAAGQVLDGGHLVCVDTYCFGGGYLSAFETRNCEVIQADLHGHLRRAPVQIMAARFSRLFRSLGRLCRPNRPDKNPGDDTKASPDESEDESTGVQIATDAPD